jgi:dihydroneopterin aldolase
MVARALGPGGMSRTIADAASGTRHVFLRDMVLQASIGIYPHEHAATQRVRINVDLGVVEGVGRADRLERVVDYEKVANTVRSIATSGHVNLVETLAERIASACLRDDRVRLARVRVEKLDVFEDTVSVGVEVERRADRAGACISSTA